MFNPLDLHAVADVTPVEEAAYDNAVRAIGALDGKALFESDTVDAGALLDAFGMPDVFAPTTVDRWDDLDELDKAAWDRLAAAVRAFGLCSLDEDKAVDHADDLAA